MSWGSCVKIALLLTSGDLQSAEVRHQFNVGDVTWGALWWLMAGGKKKDTSNHEIDGDRLG